MDSPAPSPDSLSRHRQVGKYGWFIFLTALLIYAGVLAQHMGAYAGGSDSSGYLNNARLLRSGHVHLERRAIEALPSEKASSFTYIPLGFIPVGTHAMVPTYPTGLSLMIAGASYFSSWETAPHIVMWCHGVLGVLLLFRLAREIGFSVGLASVASLLLGLSPLYLFMSVQAMSDGPSLVWCTAAIVFALQSRRNALWAIAAGVSTAIAVLVRPSDLLIVLPMALCLGLDWKRWWWLGVGGAPGAVFLGLLNRTLYGSPFATGYGAVGGIFSWEYFPPALSNYLTWFPVLLTPGVLLVLGLPWLRRTEPARITLMLAVWSLVFATFYSFYFHTHESWWYLRFVLPTFPPLILVMLLVWRHLTSRWSEKSQRTASAVALLAVLIWNVAWSARLNALESGRGERVYPTTAEWARDHLPANAVIMTMQTSGALLYYTNFVLVRWDQFDLSSFSQIERACEASGRPLYAILFPEERTRVLGKLLPDGWTQMGAVQRVTIWKRTPNPPTTAPAWDVFLTEKTKDREIMVRGVSGWFGVEHGSHRSWMWSSGQGEIELETWPKKSGAVVLKFSLRAMTPSEITLTQKGGGTLKRQVARELVPIEIPIQLTDGFARLTLSSNTPPVKENTQTDPRDLSFAVYDPTLKVPSNE